MGSFSEFVVNAGMHAEGALNQIKDVVQNPEVWIPTATGVGAKVTTSIGAKLTALGANIVKGGVVAVVQQVLVSHTPAPFFTADGRTVNEKKLPEGYSIEHNMVLPGLYKPGKMVFPDGSKYSESEVILDENGVPQVVNVPGMDGDAPAMEAGKKLHRPYIRKKVREEVNKKAPKTSDGQYIDPNTLKPIDGKPDLGHKPGNEFWRERDKAENEGLDQKEFNNKMNNPDLYQLEDPSSNRSHKYEMPKE